MRVLCLMAVCWCALSGSVHAQGHPCDATWAEPQRITAGEATAVQICAGGDPTDVQVIVNGIAHARQSLRVVTSTNRDGMALYECAERVVVGPGAYAMQARLYRGGVEVAQTAPTTITAAEEWRCTITQQVKRLTGGKEQIVCTFPSDVPFVKGDVLIVSQP